MTRIALVSLERCKLLATGAGARGRGGAGGATQGPRDVSMQRAERGSVSILIWEEGFQIRLPPAVGRGTRIRRDGNVPAPSTRRRKRGSIYESYQRGTMKTDAEGLGAGNAAVDSRTAHSPGGL